MFNPKRFDVLSQKEVGENSLGEPKYEYQASLDIYGWLDMLSGTDLQNIDHTIVPESTHVLITDGYYTGITAQDRIYNPKTSLTFEITYVDDVMEDGDHLEIYCKVLP